MRRRHQLFEHLLLAACCFLVRGIFYNLFVIFCNLFVIFCNLSESFGIFLNLLESFGIFWNLVESLESLSSFVSLGLRSSSEIHSSSWSILGALGLESISSLVTAKLFDQTKLLRMCQQNEINFSQFTQTACNFGILNINRIRIMICIEIKYFDVVF